MYNSSKNYFLNFKKCLFYLHSFTKISRLPFLMVGILPFILGTILAFKIEKCFIPNIFWISLLIIVLIMLSTYHAGEFFDFKEDNLSKKNSIFAGGSGFHYNIFFPRKITFWLSLIEIIVAIILGLFLQVYFQLGKYLILLGLFGIISGFFYSSRPIRFVKRGIGEILIGLCYGWLPITCAFYIQTGKYNSIINWISIPISLSIFNVIFLNEFLDYTTDLLTNKKNLLIRVGLQKGRIIYIIVTLSIILFMFFSIFEKIFLKKFLFIYLLLTLLMLITILFIIYNKYYNQYMLKITCGINLITNLIITTLYILVFVTI